jgi:hypothetical protein
LLYLIANFDILTLNQRFNAKKSLKINQKFSFSTRRQYFAFLTAFCKKYGSTEEHSPLARATGYQVVCSLWAIMMLVFELRSENFRESGAFFGCLGLIYA